MGRKIADFPLEELKKYRPDLTNKPADFDEFWRQEKEKMETVHPKVAVEWRKPVVPNLEVADLEFTSWDETPIKGILVKPEGAERGPVIFHFHGYTGRRGLMVDYLKWTSLGVTVVAFDVRGQGDSPDFARYPHASQVPGWMLHGILHKENYYYTNVYRDILLQLKWLRSGEAPVVPEKLGFAGGSQGGALALAAAALDGKPDFAMADYPFLAHFDRALNIALSGPYLEIVDYFKWNDPEYRNYDRILNTLGYIDCVHFCNSIECPTIMAIGLEDAVTPPSTVFAAYNHINSSDKSIHVYPQFTHEVNPFHEEKKLRFIVEQIENNHESESRN